MIIIININKMQYLTAIMLIVWYNNNVQVKYLREEMGENIEIVWKQCRVSN